MSSVRVRFAPSPTGYLHIGGARTALYNYLFARTIGGTFVLRIEDTDLERSRREYEELQIKDLYWLGMKHDEGPDVGGNYGPYRQSERLDIYKKYADQLIDEGKAFYCFCTEEELEAKKEKALAAGGHTHYDGTCRQVTKSDALARIAAGEKAVVRLKAPRKAYELNDKVRGKVVFPEDMVGDFVLLRSDGMPVYNYCCVVDDWLMKITHVIRGEDHLSNTVRQLMLYEAFEVTPPIFAHLSLLIGQDRQKLSKRHGATSVILYREEGYIPDAMVNYLVLLGWSHPDEKEIFHFDELSRMFDIDRFSKAAAIYDLEKFKWVNGQHLRQLDNASILSAMTPVIPEQHRFHQQSLEWKMGAIELLKEKIQLFKDIVPYLDSIFDPHPMVDAEFPEIKAWPTTPKIAEYLRGELAHVTHDYVTKETYEKWADHVKKEMKIKGKELFKGIRACLTGNGHGPELVQMVPLTPVSVLKERVENMLR